MIVLREMLVILAFACSGTAAASNPSSTAPTVLRSPGDAYFLLTPAPLRRQREWGLDNLPVRAFTRVQVLANPRLDYHQFDYSLPASYRRTSGSVPPTRPDVRYGKQYTEWLEQQVHKQYTRRLEDGKEIHVVLGSAGQQYLFHAKQALLLHSVQKGLRKVSTTLNLEETPFHDPVENVRLRAFLESSFDSLRQSPHPHQLTYPQVLRLALLRIREQQKTEFIYQNYASIFDDNWNVVFPFLQDDRIDMVEYLLRPY